MLPDDLLRRMRVRLKAFEAEARVRRESVRRRSVVLRTIGKLCPMLAVLGLAGWALGQGVEIKTSDGGADQTRFKVETGAATVSAYFLNSKVGIGTNNPQSALHVYDAASEAVIRTESGAANGNKARFLSFTDGRLWIQSGSAWSGGSTADIRFSGMFGSPVHMTIASATGNIGIGTTAPLYPLHLHRDDGLSAGEHVLGVFRRDASGGGAVFAYQADGAAVTASRIRSSQSTDLRLGTGGNGDSMTILAANGNVGIGTTAPENRLHVEDLTSTHVAAQLENADAVAGLELETQTATASGEAILNLGVNTNRALLEKGANPTGLWFRMDTRAGVKQFGWFSELAGVDTETQLMSLTEAGYLGVATTAPATLLHVNGTTDTELATHGLLVLGPTTGANLSMDQNEIMARNNGAESNLFLQNDGGDVVIHGGAAAATKIIFKDNGDVGIGTTTPAVPFHIVSTGDDKFRIEGDGSGRIGIQLYQGATHRSTWAYDATNNRTVIRAYNGGIADRMRMLDGFDGIQGDGNFNDNAFGPSEWVIGRAEPGDVLCMQGTRLDEDGKKRAVVTPCGEKNCPRVIGVVIPTDEIPHHGNPVFEHQDKLGTGAEWLVAWRKNHVGMELTGFREVKVIAPVRVGDLLVASGLPGYARAKKNPKPGTCIGKAAESLEEGKGTVWTRVHLQ